MGGGCCTTNQKHKLPQGQAPAPLAKGLLHSTPHLPRAYAQGELDSDEAKEAKKQFRKQGLMQGLVIRRPNKRELQLDTSTSEDGQQEKLEIFVDDDFILRERLSVYFIVDFLILKLRPSDASEAIKKSRLDKWHKMITSGLDSDIAHKVFVITKAQKKMEPK